jgi:hypothetical protein
MMNKPVQHNNDKTKKKKKIHLADLFVSFLLMKRTTQTNNQLNNIQNKSKYSEH